MKYLNKKDPLAHDPDVLDVLLSSDQIDTAEVFEALDIEERQPPCASNIMSYLAWFYDQDAEDYEN